MRKSIKLALAGVSVLGAVGLAASPAFASGTPVSASGTATITINTLISFGFDSSSTFALTPNVNTPDAVKFHVATNNPHGFSVAMSAPDPTDPGPGGQSFPASYLTYDSLQVSGGELNTQSPVNQLSNTPAVAFTSSQPTALFSVTQTWKANIPAIVAPGNYQSNILYVATVNP
jgi:hypothetical protein